MATLFACSRLAAGRMVVLSVAWVMSSLSGWSMTGLGIASLRLRFAHAQDERLSGNLAPRSS